MTETEASMEGKTKPLPVASREARLSYQIGRGEQGVLTVEPYKTSMLPVWRFSTPAIAKDSSTALWTQFLNYEQMGDFVGMDMARKFIQMGMTRAKRYANYKGGRKYEKDGTKRDLSDSHPDHKKKLEASNIFKEVWERCKVHEGYQRMKKEFIKEQKAYKSQQTERSGSGDGRSDERNERENAKT